MKRATKEQYKKINTILTKVFTDNGVNCTKVPKVY